MPTIKLEKGSVKIKDRLTRKERRDIKNSITRHLEAVVGGEGETTMKPGSMLEAQDEAIIFVIDEIKIDGEVKSVSQKTLDNEEWISDDEYQQIEDSCNEVLSPNATKVKKK